MPWQETAVSPFCSICSAETFILFPADVKEIAGSKARAAAEEESSKLQAELQSRLDHQSAELDSVRSQVSLLALVFKENCHWLLKFEAACLMISNCKFTAFAQSERSCLLMLVKNIRGLPAVNGRTSRCRRHAKTPCDNAPLSDEVAGKTLHNLLMDF